MANTWASVGVTLAKAAEGAAVIAKAMRDAGVSIGRFTRQCAEASEAMEALGSES